MKNLILLFSSLWFSFPVFGQQQHNLLSLEIEAVKKNKAVFHKTNLFAASGKAKSDARFDDLLADGQLFTLDRKALETLFAAKHEAIELSLPTGGDKPLKMELVRRQLLTDDFTVVASHSNGQPVDYQPGVYYRGIIDGDSESLAAISLFEDEVIGVISTKKEGNRVLGKTSHDPKTDAYIFYREDDLLIEHGFTCETEDKPVNGNHFPGNVGMEKVDKCVRAYLELEYDLVIEKGGATGATNFITGLFNVVAALYQNEAITTYISQVFTWTTPDSYPTSSTSAALNSFRSFRPTFNGDVAHLISRGAPTGGGIAWVDALCTAYDYAYSYINSSYAQLPTYSWSVNVITHEMGHNLGSPHTHACAWNGNNTAIDGCGPAVGANEGCNASIPASGTIMSYCHLISGVGINLSNGFGPQPGNLIRSRVTSASCLVVCNSGCVTLTTGGNNVSCNGGSNGTATLAVSGGTTPYTFAWSNGATSQNLSNLPAGTYTVTVTSASGCTGTASRIVTQPTAITTNFSVTNTSNGQNNGAINLTPGGGTPNYTYLWSNGFTGQDPSNLAPGTYSVTVTDANGCTKTGSATVQQGASTSMTLSFNVTNATQGSSNGAVDLTVTGGTPGYTYIWSNGATTQDLLNVPAGTYNVTVKDATNATVTGSATVGTTSSGGCSAPLALPHSNSFENGLGGWIQATNDQMDWTILSGSTPTTNTGPDVAANGTKYIYTEATNNTNKIAYLESPCFNIAGINTFQFNFSFHIYGNQMGTLRLQYASNGSSTWNTIWTISGNGGNAWYNQAITITNNGVSTIRFRFFATTGGNRSDMAVDNINIVSLGALPGDLSDLQVVEIGKENIAPVQDLSLSPNPASEQLQIIFTSGEEDVTRLTISDQTGNVVRREVVSTFDGATRHSLNVSELPQGLYFLTLSNSTGHLVEKFVIVR
jgi:hypothetical protein